ncbi:MAG TPA: hypothetical protein VKR58_03965, partial [Aquella sp.]|nr:hypothetical protein [Aquella sp.]
VVLRLPYHGEIEKSKIDWTNVHNSTLTALVELVQGGLVNESPEKYTISQEGWYWYVNMMYYLSPPEEKIELDLLIHRKQNQKYLATTKIPL